MRWSSLVLLLAACRAAPSNDPSTNPPPPSTTSTTTTTATTDAQAPVDETPQPVAVRINADYAGDDAKRWTKNFEHDGREVYDRRADIVAALGLSPGMRIADVGAGSGLFTLLFAAAVGPTGRVFAVDVQPSFVAQITTRAREAGLGNVDARLGDQRGSGLDEASVDVVFLCDAYHHLELPKTYLADLHRVLVPGGRLVVIDYDRTHRGANRWMRDHIRADPADLRREIESAGFVPADSSLRLRENFVAVFSRPAG